MTQTRVNPLDLTDFAPKPPDAAAKPGAAEVIDAVAKVNQFPSRQPVRTKPDITPAKKKPRRYTTGRNQQLNIKVTPETALLMTQLADEMHVPLGELLQIALDAFRRTKA